MPPKKNEQTYQFVQRSLHDPAGFGEDAKGAFVEVESRKKVINLAQLEKDKDQFKQSGQRENEGEAALYGITYDDSNYDYMQHFRKIGQHEDAYFINVDGSVTESYRPPEADNRLMISDLLNEGNLDTKKLNFKEHYQAMLPIQDSIGGLQPDMDPRLMEVLDALDDENYIDVEEDIFSELIQTGEVKSEQEWRKTAPKEEIKQKDDEQDWEFAFRKFKLQGNNVPNDSSDADSLVSSAAGGFSEEERDTVPELSAVKANIGPLKSEQKKKKKIGAKTDLTGFSMSSSANYRNEGLTLVDDAFEKVELDYLDNDSAEEPEGEFDMSKERPDFENILDEFLDDYVVEGKHLYKKNKNKK
ncbi:Ltv1 protein [Starmerella bacillaris]|uniref:Ltv1 protein n=1 Tax=Starmerella bacillaris TaxID=1247836 RepID=A0AAV5RM56_STABA|nr:Ltv1 protein [Starmerella bacillaris]